jgi:hypothetical protein
MTICVCKDCHRDEFTKLLRKQLKLDKFSLRANRHGDWTVSTPKGSNFLIYVYHSQDPHCISTLSSHRKIAEFELDRVNSHIQHCLSLLKWQLEPATDRRSP